MEKFASAAAAKQPNSVVAIPPWVLRDKNSIVCKNHQAHVAGHPAHHRVGVRDGRPALAIGLLFIALVAGLFICTETVDIPVC